MGNLDEAIGPCRDTWRTRRLPWRSARPPLEHPAVGRRIGRHPVEESVVFHGA
jgi:hypothetical protein